ncbi:MAG: hypothetical protein D6694_05950 [Gammaproteobacteria bacterium]|nr:MAG: hypothetical protein D6694_05950 [Gammaproteobacteria bacterium]
MAQKDIVEGLVGVLLDSAAELAERDDAAMDLGEFDDARALNALYQVASNHAEDETLAASCGESIAQIWLRRGVCDEQILEALHPSARREILALISSKNRELLSDSKR